MGSLVTFVFQVCFVFKRSYVVGMEARQAQEEEEIFPAVGRCLCHCCQCDSESGASLSFKEGHCEAFGLLAGA